MSSVSSYGASGNGRPGSNGADFAGRAPRSIDLGRDPANLVFTIDNVRREVAADHFDDPTQFSELCTRILSAAHTTCQIEALLSWPQSARSEAIRALGEMGTGVGVIEFVGDAAHPAGSFFDAVLRLIRSYSEINRVSTAINVAIEAAIAAHPDNLPLAADRIRRQIRSAGIQGYGVRAINRLIDERMLSARGRETVAEVQTIGNLMPELEGVEDLICPAGWRVGDNGVISLGANRVVVDCPIVISRILIDVDARESIELAWVRFGRLQRRVVSRTVIATSREANTLSAFGIGVTSNTAADTVQYLADFLQANRDVLPRTRLTRQIGWQGNFDCFLWGRNVLTGETVSGESEQRHVDFHGDGDGDEQLVDGFTSAGTMESWIEVVRALQPYPRVLLAIYASLAAPLLSFVDSPNFVLSYAGITSCGKTTTLRVGASVWGQPDKESPQSLIYPWSATRVWFERSASTLSSLPNFLDDTKHVHAKEDVAKIVYEICGGRGRGRGDVRGTSRVLNWRTILISTGEDPLASFSSDGGTRARILEVGSSPFIETSEYTANIVNTVIDGLRQHFGHAGPTFIRFVLANRNRWERWRELYRDYRLHFQRTAATNTVAGRMAEHFAVLQLAELLAHEALPLPWNNGNIVTALWSELTNDTPEADRAGVALDHVVQWAESHREEFSDQRLDRQHSNAPANGWAGRWRFCASGEFVLAFHPFRLNQLLEQAGFNPAATRRTWHDRGWLCCSAGKRTYKARIDPHGPPMEAVAIRWSVINERLEDGAEPQLRSAETGRPRVGGNGGEQSGGRGNTQGTTEVS